MERIPSNSNTIRKAVTSVSEFNFLFSFAPIFAPIYAAGITGMVYSHGTFPNDIWVAELTIDDKNTINMEVPTATCGGKRNNKIIAGTIIDPPPIPNNPEAKPITNVKETENHIHMYFLHP